MKKRGEGENNKTTVNDNLKLNVNDYFKTQNHSLHGITTDI